MAELLKSYGILIVAAIALLQPWLWALWKRYFRKGQVEMYETGNLEIGYSGFGPTIGLHGTLRCIHRDLFIQTIKLVLVKKKDSSKHVFEWGVFRAEKLAISGEIQGTFELPRGFMLSTTSPRPFNIQFHDTQLQSEIIQVINNVSKEWGNEVAGLERARLFELLSEDASLPAELRDPYSALYEEFRNGNVHVQAYTALDRMCYWEAGEYTLKMTVCTTNPDRLFEKNWAFSLAEEEVQTIRLNVIKMLRDTCGRPAYGQYFFAFPKYKSQE